eukprot:1144388-Pelagomonas_calceolata.AAC.4
MSKVRQSCGLMVDLLTRKRATCVLLGVIAPSTSLCSSAALSFAQFAAGKEDYGDSPQSQRQQRWGASGSTMKRSAVASKQHVHCQAGASGSEVQVWRLCFKKTSASSCREEDAWQQ